MNRADATRVPSTAHAESGIIVTMASCDTTAALTRSPMNQSAPAPATPSNAGRYGFLSMLAKASRSRQSR